MCYNLHQNIVFRSCMHSHTRIQKDVDCYQPDCKRSVSHPRNCRFCVKDPDFCRTKRLPHKEVEVFDSINLCPWCASSQPRMSMRV